MSKFRPQRRTLAEAMDEMVEIDGMAGLRKHLERDGYRAETLDKMTVEAYFGIDKRIGWDTYIVHSEGYGVLGFTDGPLV